MNYFFLYIDPGSGSYIVQVIAAAVLGFLFFFKNIWYKITSFFKKRKPEEEKDIDNEASQK